MKQLLIFLGAGFVIFQFLFVFALMAAAKRPTPQFTAEAQPEGDFFGETEAEPELELVEA